MYTHTHCIHTHAHIHIGLVKYKIVSNIIVPENLSVYIKLLILYIMRQLAYIKL